MRSIWNGAISFGLVSIPIKVVNATESHSISFRQIHLDDGGRIRYRKVCELEDSEVSTAEIGKAYEDADGTLIPITDEDLASLPIPTARTIEIVAFVPADRIDPLQMDTAYYLSANGVPAAKPYVLLREALKRSQKVAVAKFALRGRERLGMLRVVGDVIAMHGLLWPDEIRATDEVAPDADVTVRDKELDLADALMDTLGEVDLADLHDDYREAVEELVTAKAEGHEAPAAPPGEVRRQGAGPDGRPGEERARGQGVAGRGDRRGRGDHRDRRGRRGHPHAGPQVRHPRTGPYGAQGGRREEDDVHGEEGGGQEDRGEEVDSEEVDGEGVHRQDDSQDDRQNDSQDGRRWHREVDRRHGRLPDVGQEDRRQEDDHEEVGTA